VIAEDQRLTQIIGVLESETFVVEVSIRRLNDSVMIRAEYYNVPADIQTALSQILNIKGFRKGIIVNIGING
jgi:hypothetical protein